MDLRLLVLSVGTRVGQNVLTSLKDRRDRLLVLGDVERVQRACPVRLRCRLSCATHGRGTEAFERALLDIMAQERVDLVIPCRDDDVEFLASLRDRRPELSSRLLCGSTAPVRVISDKWLSARIQRPARASVCGVDDQVQRRGARRLCRKARLSAGGKAAPRLCIAGRLYDLERRAARSPCSTRTRMSSSNSWGIADTSATILRRWRSGHSAVSHIPGSRHSIQALIAPDGAIAHVMSIRIVSDRRRSKWVGLDTDPEPVAIGRQMRCGVCRLRAGVARSTSSASARRTASCMIHEFNGRFTGATFERWLLGYDEVGAAITSFTGRPMPSPGSRATPCARGIRDGGGPCGGPCACRRPGARWSVEAAGVSEGIGPGLFVCVGTFDARAPGWLTMHERDDADVAFRSWRRFPFDDRGATGWPGLIYCRACHARTCIRFLLECRRVLKPRGLLSLRASHASARRRWPCAGIRWATSLTGLEAASASPVAHACRRCAGAYSMTPMRPATTMEYTKRDRGVFPAIHWYRLSFPPIRRAILPPAWTARWTRPIAIWKSSSATIRAAPRSRR